MINVPAKAKQWFQQTWNGFHSMIQQEAIVRVKPSPVRMLCDQILLSKECHAWSKGSWRQRGKWASCNWSPQFSLQREQKCQQSWPWLYLFQWLMRIEYVLDGQFASEELWNCWTLFQEISREEISRENTHPGSRDGSHKSWGWIRLGLMCRLWGGSSHCGSRQPVMPPIHRLSCTTK